MHPVLIVVLCALVLVLGAAGAAVAGALVFAFLPSNRRAFRMVQNFPVLPSCLPILGHIFLLLKVKDNLFWFSRDMFKDYGSRYVTSILNRPAVNVCDPIAAEAILTSSKNIEKGLLYNFLKPWLGEGLLTSSGALWHSRRKLLTPAFHFRILGQFSEHLEHQAESLVQEFTKARLSAGPGNTLDVVPLFSRATLRSIRVTAMGEVDFQTSLPGGEESYFQAVHRVGRSVVHRIIRPWLWSPLGFWLFSPLGAQVRKDLQVLHSFTKKVINDRKCQPTKLEQLGDQNNYKGTKNKHVQPFLDVLLSAQRDGQPLSDGDIREEVDTFMFEGHDTTAMALSWALELLGRHPAEQEALAEEVRAAGSDWESVSRLPYLDRVFKECLRLRPSVPFIGRFTVEDVDLGGGQVIPKGSGVHIHIYDLHRHPEHFPDPERFDPDRFLPECEQKRHPFAYIPFSAGPRNCIGRKFAQMEVKLFLAAIVRSFVIRSAMPENPDAIADLVLRPRAGILLKLTPRHL